MLAQARLNADDSSETVASPRGILDISTSEQSESGSDTFSSVSSELSRLEEQLQR
jgi:hypothetical protein